MPATSWARPTTSASFLTADNVGDTIDYIQHARPNLRAVFGHAVVPAVEEVHGVIESLFHVGSTTNIRIDGALHVIRSGTPVTVIRAAGRPSVIFPPALERTVRPITPKIPLAQYISPAVPVPTSLRPGTIIDSYAGDVDSDDVGHQVSFAVGDVEVFGTLERVMPGTLSRTVALTVDGTVFNMPSGKPVTVTVARLQPAAKETMASYDLFELPVEGNPNVFDPPVPRSHFVHNGEANPRTAERHSSEVVIRMSAIGRR